MNKQEFQQLSDIFDDIAFIEKLEQMAKNNGGQGGLIFMVASSIPRVNLCGYPFQPTSNALLTIPENLSKNILADLVSYKDAMKEMLENLAVVDKSSIPESPEENTKPDNTGGEESSED